MAASTLYKVPRSLGEGMGGIPMVTIHCYIPIQCIRSHDVKLSLTHNKFEDTRLSQMKMSVMVMLRGEGGG